MFFLFFLYFLCSVHQMQQNQPGESWSEWTEWQQRGRRWPLRGGPAAAGMSGHFCVCVSLVNTIVYFKPRKSQSLRRCLYVSSPVVWR